MARRGGRVLVRTDKETQARRGRWGLDRIGKARTGRRGCERCGLAGLDEEWPVRVEVARFSRHGMADAGWRRASGSGRDCSGRHGKAS